MNVSLNSLPLDAVVQILCKLNHDELKSVINVSKFFNIAVHRARQRHFDYSTPAPKKGVFCGEVDEAPSAPIKRESKKSRKITLSEEETMRITTVLFPVGDCKKGLASRLNFRHEKFSSHHPQRALQVSQANSFVQFT